MKAFTIIELLIVLFISAVLVSVSTGVYTTLNKRSTVDIEARKLASTLNLARSRALASDTAQSYGVRIIQSANQYILFPGTVYSVSNPDNERFEISSNTLISSLNISSGGSDIVFERLTGAALQFGFVTFSGAGNSENSLAVCVARSGTISIEQLRCALDSLEYTLGTTNSDLASFPANSGFGDPAQGVLTGLDNIYVHRAELYLRKTVPDPSDIFLEIRSSNTIGAVIGRSWTIDGGSLPSNFGWVSFVFPSPVFLSANTQYFLRLRSLPDSTVVFSGAQGFIYWGYAHSAFVPPAYAGGDAWRYVGRNNTPTDQGQRLGPADQYDFSFRLIYGVIPPSMQDSRHLEFDIADSSGRGWTIRNASTLRIVFHDPPNSDVTENISMANYFNSGGTIFNWQGSVNVRNDTETLRVHTHYIDANDTTLSIHRDRGANQKAVDISIDGRAIVSYAVDGAPTVGAWGGTMVFR